MQFSIFHKMEKFILKIITASLALLVLTAAGQAADWEFDKGSVELSGAISLESRDGELYENYEGDSPDIFILSLGYQYFVRSGFSIGGNIEIDTWSENDFGSREISLGPALTYYFGNENLNIWHQVGTNRSSPFVGIGFMYGVEKYSYKYDFSRGDYSSSEINYTSTTIQLTTGVSFNLVDHYNLKAGLYFDKEGRKRDEPGAKLVSGSVIGMKFGFSGFIY